MIIDTHINYTEYSNISLSLLDLSKVDNFVSELNTIIDTLAIEDPDIICKIRQESHTFDKDYIYYNSTTLDFLKNSTWKNLLLNYFTNVKTYTIETFENGGTNSAYTDTYLMIFDSDGTLIYENDDKSPDSFYSKLIMPLVSGETYFIVCFDEWGKTGAYSILVNETGNGASMGTPLENSFEPNNNSASAQSLEFNVVQDHYLSFGDNDWMYVKIP